ncbi:MAG TPA: hypothetical protein VF416_04855 [Marmoricola sp.]
MRVAELAGAAGVLLVAVLPGGCGQGAGLPLPDHLAGHEVGAMAERELEAENPRIAPGRLACPDLELRTGASVRCLRTAELSEGRVVKVRGTVSVTSLAAGGRLHVSMDPGAEEFGMTGAQLAAELRRRYSGRPEDRPARVTCPYLRAEIGQRVICRVDLAGAARTVEVAVTAVDAEQYRTTYVVRDDHGHS